MRRGRVFALTITATVVAACLLVQAGFVETDAEASAGRKQTAPPTVTPTNTPVVIILEIAATPTLKPITPTTTPKPTAAPSETLKAVSAPATDRQTEINMIAQTIYGHMCESELEKQCVGECIINRVQSEGFPNTVYEVITQRRQFEKFKATYPITEQNLRIATMVYEGMEAEARGIEYIERLLPRGYVYYKMSADEQHHFYSKVFSFRDFEVWTVEGGYDA